jgi:serine/threonine-protein kinase HipA
MSLAGAQHKLLVVYQDGKLYEPEGATPSTHILKPNHPDTGSYPASVVNEYVTMRIAAAVGLPVPAVHIRYVPDPVYIVDRFDRRVTVLEPAKEGIPKLDVQRLHIIDACQLLNRARTFKHSGASLEALHNIIERTTNKLHSRLQLFRWLVFNVVMANDDCHLKNLSFFVAPDGIKLAPHYDLLATCAYYTRAFADDRATWANVPMAIALPGAKVFGAVTGASVLQAGLELGVPPAAARRILADVATSVPVALKRQMSELAQRHAALPPEAGVYLAAEKRLMRVLEQIIVPEMLGRLSPTNP